MKRVFRILLIFSLAIFFTGKTYAQPNWVPGTPSVPSTGPLTITTNYGIDVQGYVYIIVYNWKVETPLSGFDVKIRAQAGPNPGAGRVATAIITISSGDVGKILTTIFDVLNANSLHTVFFAAENTSGQIQANSVMIYATTLPCPKVQLFTFFGN
ncbi:MAG TPA: hypothetical protein PK064_12905, partial [Bacteroidales bacterium]|nr:hypothetical protein [Bacteroidales bacterium]